VSLRDRFLAACHAADERTARACLAAAPERFAGVDATELVAQLGRAAGRGRAEAVRVMLALDFPVVGPHAGSATPLHEAAWRGRPECVQVLLRHGAPVNVREDEFGCSPLAWACHGSANCREADDDYLAVVDLLLDAGADRDTAVNRWGAGPERMGRPAISARLVERGFPAPDDTDGDG
jgi:ankyrin repeat protein